LAQPVPGLFGGVPPGPARPVGTPRAHSVRHPGAFQSADRRIFGGQTEDYLADFSGTVFGSDRIGPLRGADSLIRRVLGTSTYRLSLGAERARGQLTIGSGMLAPRSASPAS